MRRKKKAVEEISNDKWKGDQKGEIKRGDKKRRPEKGKKMRMLESRGEQKSEETEKS